MSAYITRPSLAESIGYYRSHAGDFVRDQLGAIPDPWQEEVLRAYPFEESISIRSGNGVGKTALGSWVFLHFLACCFEAKVVVTAPTSHQLHDNLWAEVAKWYERSTLTGVITKMASKYFVNGREENWFGVPRSTTSKENFQGYHSKNVLFIVDEASGVAADIFEAIEGGRATDHAQVLQISNPTRLTGAFHDSHHRLKKFWRTFHVDSEDHSRVRRVNTAFIEQMAEKYGRNSPIYQVKVRGNFPMTDDMAIVSRTAFEAAFERREVEACDGKQMGVDPARFGSDFTGIVVREGHEIRYAQKIHGLDNVEVAKVVEKVATDHGFTRNDPILVDTIGIGSGVYDHLNKYARQLRVVSINSSLEAKNKKLYYNTRTEMFFEFNAWLSRIRFHEDVARYQDELLEDLCYVNYGFDDRGRYQAEKKDRIKEKIGGRSPDLGDALVMSCYNPKRFTTPMIYVPGNEDAESRSSGLIA